MVAVRKTRATETRGMKSRKAEARVVPRTIFTGKFYIDPEKIPPDKCYGWIRISCLNQPDDGHWGDKAADGWAPVPRDRHPDLYPYIPVPGQQEIYSSVIVRGGLILCEKDKWAVEAERDRIQTEALEQVESIDQQGWIEAKGSDPQMKRYSESKTNIQRVTAEFKQD